MKLLIAVLALVALAGCSGSSDTWDEQMAPHVVTVRHVKAIKAELDSVRADIAALRAELKEARP